MKYIILFIGLFTGQLIAQTTQPIKSSPTTQEMKKKVTTQPMKSTTQPTSQKATKTSAMEAERMSKFGLAESDKNSIGGLELGQNAPRFSGKDQNGDNLELAELLKKGKVVVFFYRGYWCGICSQQLSELEGELKSITDSGATVIAVTTESNEFAKKTVEKNNLTFSVISDTDNIIARDYKVLYEVSEGYQKRVADYTKSDLQTFNDSEEAFLPIPATYIIEQDGSISYMHYTIDYSDRATVEEIKAALK